jgi:hypothetical protein
VAARLGRLGVVRAQGGECEVECGPALGLGAGEAEADLDLRLPGRTGSLTCRQDLAEGALGLVVVAALDHDGRQGEPGSPPHGVWTVHP